ncbi:DUF2388 domain-containing protein [Cognatilysobacter terrigena]|uniref:DUF2388 domain-containing protein n=1 Tax=Cognatilysobacter terrigena TaxID=2488749 RepID=UPI0010613789|nr:DUF2388 domain-containing protein [Lysobacter terrigena]
MTTTRTLLATAIALALPLSAAASSFAGSSAGSSAGASSNSSGSSSGDDKVVMQARDDAALFVATDGRVRGAQLEAALRLMREHRADAQSASDLQLAMAILAR